MGACRTLILGTISDTNGFDPVYLGLRGIDINIDGEITSYSARNLTDLNSSAYNSVTQSITTESKNRVVIPFAVLEEMVYANDCRIRIYTSKGYEDARFSLEQTKTGASTAIVAIQQFMARIEPLRISR